MREIKQIFDKEKYMSLLLEADPEKEIVKKYLKKCGFDRYYKTVKNFFY